MPRNSTVLHIEGWHTLYAPPPNKCDFAFGVLYLTAIYSPKQHRHLSKAAVRTGYDPLILKLRRYYASRLRFFSLSLRLSKFSPK